MVAVRIHCIALAVVTVFAATLITAFGVSGDRLAKAFVPELRKLADGGDAYAQAVLALSYANGDRGLALSIAEAEKWARLSAAQQHPIGKFAMGYLAQSPILGLDDTIPGRYYRSAFGDSSGDLVKMAISGDPIASYVVGMILTSDYLRPKVVPDMNLAARHHSVASRADFLPSVFQLGIMKVEGMLTEKDVEGGLDLLERAVSGNLPAAHHYMGLVHLNGKVLPENREMALVHFQKAADLGHAESMLLTAEFYAFGIVTPVDLSLAKQYALRSANLKQPKAKGMLLEIESEIKSLSPAGSPPASSSSGITDPTLADPPVAPPSPAEFSSSNPPIPPPLPLNPGPKDSSSGPTVLPRPPSPGQPSFLPSPDIPIRPSKPPSAIRESPPSVASSPKTSVEARELAKRHYTGVGVPVDYAAAHRHFQAAAEAGDAEAARYLGIIYLRGKGVSVDRPEAAKWLRRAAAGGDALAKRNLELLEQLLAP